MNLPWNWSEPSHMTFEQRMLKVLEEIRDGQRELTNALNRRYVGPRENPVPTDPMFVSKPRSKK